MVSIARLACGHRSQVRVQLALGPGLSRQWRFAMDTHAFAAIFDGLFVFHYFVETLIWRFGDPFFRKEAALYFAVKR